MIIAHADAIGLCAGLWIFQGEAMENSRRSNIQIIAEILRACAKANIGRTGIMYRVNLSHAQLKKYMSFLEVRRFLEPANHSSPVKYTTTAKGRKLLRDIEKILETFGLEIPA